MVQDHRGIGTAGDVYDQWDYLPEKRDALALWESELLRIVA